jgi:hypothetical protein
LALSVNDAPELTLRQSRRREPALPELGCYQRPDLVVLALALPQFDVTPADELLDRLAEVRRHVGDDPDRRGLRKAGRGGQVAREVLRERVGWYSGPSRIPTSSEVWGVSGTWHAYFLLAACAFRQDFCPIPGKNRRYQGCERPRHRLSGAYAAWQGPTTELAARREIAGALNVPAGEPGTEA